MPLPYTLHRNTIRRADADTSYRAVAKQVDYVRIEDAIREMTKPGSILKQTECEAVIYAFLNYLTQQLAEGNGFLSPYFRLTPGLRGVFESEEDKYDPKRHRPGVNFRPGKKMEQAIRKMKVQRIDSTLPAPRPLAFEDYKTGIRNQLMVPGKVGLISGEQLKLTDPDDLAQGVFLKHLSSGQFYRVADLYRNFPQELLMALPDTLPRGAYWLEVRSAYGTRGEIRTGQLPATLVVA